MNMRDAHQMLATVGLILVIAFALQLATLPPAGIVIVLVVLAVVLIGLYLHGRAQAKAGAASPAPRVREIASPDGEPVRVLESGGVYQSATYLDDRRFEPVFAYQRAFEVMFEVEQEMRAAHGHGIERALAIGGGGFAWPKYALTRHPELILDVVESDPSVIELARRWFFVDELKSQVGDRLYIMEADGRELIDELAPGMEFAATPTAVHCRAPYDAVVNDTFSGAEPVRAEIKPPACWISSRASRETCSIAQAPSQKRSVGQTRDVISGKPPEASSTSAASSRRPRARSAVARGMRSPRGQRSPQAPQ